MILASSIIFIRQVVAIITISLKTIKAIESANMSFDILANIAAKIDLYGKKRLQQNNFLDDISLLPDDDRNKTTLYLRLSNHFSASSSYQYVETTFQLLQLLNYILTNYKYVSRHYVLKSLETLSKLSQVPENISVINNCPSSLLVIIKDLIGLSYHNNINNESKNTNIQIIKKNTTPNKDAVTDIELRDTALDCLFHISFNSSIIQNKIIIIPKFLEILFRISYVPINNKTEGNHRASQILSVLVSQSNIVHQYISSLKTELLLSATTDDNMAEIVCNKGNISILSVQDTNLIDDYMEIV